MNIVLESRCSNCNMLKSEILLTNGKQSEGLEQRCRRCGKTRTQFKAIIQENVTA